MFVRNKRNDNFAHMKTTLSTLRKKIMQFKLIAENNRICPYCHKKVSAWKSSFYFLRGTDHSIKCNHCHQRIKLKKEPIPFMLCCWLGFLTMYLPIEIYLYIYDSGFWEAVLFALPFTITLLLLICIITLIRIQFTEY